MGLFSKIRKVADRALKNIPGINVGYSIVDAGARATGLTGAINKSLKPSIKLPPVPSSSAGSVKQFTNDLKYQADNLVNRIKSLANTPQQAKANATSIANVQAQLAAMNLPLWDKIKSWFIVKWYTAKGIVIGLIVGVLLVLGLSFGIIPMPKKRRW